MQKNLGSRLPLTLTSGAVPGPTRTGTEEALGARAWGPGVHRAGPRSPLLPAAGPRTPLRSAPGHREAWPARADPGGGHGLGSGVQGTQGRLPLRILRLRRRQGVLRHVGTFHDSAGLSGSYRPRMAKKREICVQTCHESNMLSSIHNKVPIITVPAIKISQEGFEKNGEISG